MPRAGTCEALPTLCEDTQRWCGKTGDNNLVSKMVQELMAGQLANSLFGWVDAPANDLFSDEKAVIDDAGDADQQQLEDMYLRQGPGTSLWSTHA